MNNACESNMTSNMRNFGHCIVSWGIQNYGRALWQKTLELKTPEFSIKGPKSQNTKWKLILQTEPNHNNLVEELNVSVKFKEKEETSKPALEVLPEIDFKSHLSVDDKKKFDDLCSNENNTVDTKLSVKNLMLYLERSCSDEGPERVCVDWKVYYIGIKGEIVSLVHDEHIFHKKIKYGFNIGTLYDFERDFEYNSGLTTILCDMIVTTTNSTKMINDDVSIDLYGLSEDLKWIFDKQMLCDAEIRVDGKSVKAHKAMLCCHSEFFRRAVEKGSNVFELSDMKYIEVLKVLEYMYSHDLKDAVGKPSVSVYDAVIQMNLSDLAAHYAPDRVNINTKIDVNKLTYQWVIKDFAKKTECISSSILKNNHEDTAWQIHLYPKGICGKSEYIALSVECIDGTVSNDLCIQCAVLRENINHNLWKNLQTDEDNVVRDTEFILRKEAFELLNNGSLRLGFKVRTCSGKESSIDYKLCTPISCSIEKSFENMSKNMLFLRESKKYTDVTFIFGKKEIKAHKFILSARSLLFCKKFDETCNRIPQMNIRPEIFEILLDYIYCATFKVSNIDTVLNVYKCAEELLIPRLQEKCSRFLQDNIKVENVMRIFQFALEHDDKCLKETTQNWIAIDYTLRQTLRDKKFQTRETGADPKKKDIVSVECKTKSTSITKYKDITLVQHDLELAERTLSKSVSQIKQNCETSLDGTTAINVSDKTVIENLKDFTRKNKYLQDNPVVYYMVYSRKTADSDELNVPPKNVCNGMGFTDGIAETKPNEELQDDEIRQVYNNGIGKEIEQNDSLYKNDVKKVINLTTSEINASEEIMQKKNVSKLYESMKFCLKNLKECQKELDAEIAKKGKSGIAEKSLDERNGNSLESESQKNAFKVNTTLKELHENGQETLDEQCRISLKSDVDQNESLKDNPKLDTALHGNGQESLDKQNGNHLGSNVGHETNSDLIE